MFCKQRLELMAQHPPGWDPNVLVHGRRNRSDHPAVTVTATHLFPHFLSLRAIPQFIPGLGVQIAHNFLIFGAVAGHGGGQSQLDQLLPVAA